MRAVRMRAFRWLSSAAVVVAIAALAPRAAADAPGFADLPSGHATAPPENDAPASIPANEKVPGFFVAMPDFARRIPKGAPKRAKGGNFPPNPGYVVVVASADHAKRAAEGNTQRLASDPDVCFTQSRRNRISGPPHERSVEADEEDDDASAAQFPDWEEGLGSMANVYMKSENFPHGGVTAVHAERLVREGSSVRIEATDVWVDPATRGVRKIGSATLPLRLVASTRGLEVYAAREERDVAKDKLKAVHFVIVPPQDLPNPDSETLVAMHDDGRGATSTGCSHLRVAMSAGDRAAESAVLKTTLRLPDRDDREAAGEDDEKRARVREAAVHFGVSKAKRDKDPLVSVTFGWSGRETSQVIRERD